MDSRSGGQSGGQSAGQPVGLSVGRSEEGKLGRRINYWMQGPSPENLAQEMPNISTCSESAGLQNVMPIDTNQVKSGAMSEIIF